MTEPLSSHTGHFTGTQRLHAEARSCSIPATPEGAPCTDTAVPCRPAEAPINDFSCLLDASAPFPLPLASPQPLQTPNLEDRPHIDLSFAGSGLPSTNVSLPTPTVVKTAHNLRLPSFDVLGIAAPHPDHISFRPQYSFSPLGAGPLSKPDDPLHALSPPLDFPYQADGANDTPAASPKLARAQVGHIVPTWTPPQEPGTIVWGSFVNVRTAGLGSPPSSDPGVSPNLNLTASATAPGQAPIIVPTYAELSDAMRMAAWVEDVKNTITTESGCLDLDSVKILSHALPCPSLTGHLFGQIIANIHDSTTTHTLWINVFHAVPGRYTLSDLPRSPPSTPGPAVGGDSYFTSKVFDSAVAIPDYQLDSKLLPPSPRPVVPPGSINVSVVERYIPPTNTNEFAEMFTFRGRSLLHDRLIELSSDNGILLFIYPTRTGARTFMQQYLGPILDPLLRTLTVVHDLHSELGRSLGQMSAVNYLDEYDHLEAQLQKFCDALGARQGNAERKDRYEIVHASKEEMVLERSAWADDMWVKQEKPRVREAISKYFRKSKKLPTGELTGANLIQEVFDGVSKREYADGGPKKGIEVGVFIVKKTCTV
ncbi:Nn.00g013330.m01.CDS01 [Neocucurbitaria sp. VM-36]